MIDLNWLWKDKTLELLKKIKLYSSLTKTIWRTRAKREFDFLDEWKSFYKVQYFSGMDIKDVEEQALNLYKKSFWEDIDVESIVFESNDDVQWGIRLFKNHELLDMSFKNIAEKMR